ncbi:hypothetical protein BJ944DRAFT_273116 [Cunninghamella echinulata]|nr:hypothetical protein BJ944DRAFT_273116 [Cunninghamella echinulata]
MYINWTKRLQTVKRLRWYEVDTIIDVLYKLQETIFLTPGKISINYMPHFEPVQPLFDQKKRFPEGKAYLCDGIGDWTIKFHHLKLVFALIAYPNRLERQYLNIKTKGDAELFLLEIIDDMLSSMEQDLNIFDQVEFEMYYDLQWSVVGSGDGDNDNQQMDLNNITESSSAFLAKSEGGGDATIACGSSGSGAFSSINRSNITHIPLPLSFPPTSSPANDPKYENNNNSSVSLGPANIASDLPTTSNNAPTADVAITSVTPNNKTDNAAAALYTCIDVYVILTY